MVTWAEIWPPQGLRIAEDDLLLTVVSDDDLPGLVDLALSGIHDAREMPFNRPWTDEDPAQLAADMVRHYSRLRGDFTPENFCLRFAVRLDGELVGMQGFDAEDFAVTRTGETGSWLGRRFQGRGVGTRMRRAVCAFAFDGLGAEEVTSSAFLDNPASLAVSARLGYRRDGLHRHQRRPGELALRQRLVLTPSTFVRGEPIDIIGLAPLSAFLQLE